MLAQHWSVTSGTSWSAVNVGPTSYSQNVLHVRGVLVKSLIRYEPEGIIIDLAAPDLGHPDAFAIIERHYRQGSHADRRFNRFNPAFVYLKHEDGSNPGLFMKNIDGEWWAVHYEASGCKRMHIPTRMSDEHKRQAEYWARAGEDAGYRAELERSLGTGTRPDVLIHGPVQTTGIEVQRSPHVGWSGSTPYQPGSAGWRHGPLVHRRDGHGPQVALARPDRPEQGTRYSRRRPVVGHHAAPPVSDRGRAAHRAHREMHAGALRPVSLWPWPLRETSSKARAVARPVCR